MMPSHAPLPRWIPTEDLEGPAAERGLDEADGIWASPGSPYKSMNGALNGIRFARERGRPFVGTFRERILGASMVATGRGADGEIRIVELRGHPFFVATLFLPQLTSRPGVPHPLVVAYLKAALDARSRQ